jgi:excisionase family DNA binding protein
MQNDNIERIALGVDEAARALGISRSSFYLLVRTGRITLTKLGKRSVVAPEQLQRLVAS